MSPKDNFRTALILIYIFVCKKDAVSIYELYESNNVRRGCGRIYTAPQQDSFPVY